MLEATDSRQNWGRRAVLGKGAPHRGAPGSFLGVTRDPNVPIVPVADCVLARRSPHAWNSHLTK